MTFLNGHKIEQLRDFFLLFNTISRKKIEQKSESTNNSKNCFEGYNKYANIYYAYKS